MSGYMTKSLGGRTLLRGLLLFCLSVWLGGLIFFVAVVAPVAFGRLMPMFTDPVWGVHVAGTMVRSSLIVLHWMGLAAGAAMICLLATERALAWTRRSMMPAFFVLAWMMGLTAFSQFSVIPRMEMLRVQAGAALDQPDSDNPAREQFNRLHQFSTQIEGGVMLGGLVLIGLLARPEPER